MKKIRERILWGAALIFILCCIYSFLLLNGFSYKKSITSTPQANILLISESEIPTIDIGLLTSITPTVTVDPLIESQSGIQTEMYVQISGTGGSGLNIRNSPELSSSSNFIAGESEVFRVIGGPVSQDEYIWWQLLASYDETRQGWAVENYLHVITP
jgi:hypothetical protein